MQLMKHISCSLCLNQSKGSMMYSRGTRNDINWTRKD